MFTNLTSAQVSAREGRRVQFPTEVLITNTTMPMTKLLTPLTARRLKRNDAIRSEYAALAGSGQTQAIYNYLARKHKTSERTIRRIIIEK